MQEAYSIPAAADTTGNAMTVAVFNAVEVIRSSIRDS